MRIGIVVAVLAAILVAGCASGKSRQVGTFLDPVCAPDGSVVYTQYANSKGSYAGVEASSSYCPWNKK